MTQATQGGEVSAKTVALYMAMELSLKQWKLAFTVDGGKKNCVDSHPNLATGASLNGGCLGYSVV